MMTEKILLIQNDRKQRSKQFYEKRREGETRKTMLSLSREKKTKARQKFEWNVLKMVIELWSDKMSSFNQLDMVFFRVRIKLNANQRKNMIFNVSKHDRNKFGHRLFLNIFYVNQNRLTTKMIYLAVILPTKCVIQHHFVWNEKKR